MLKILYKLIGIIFFSFLVFIFIINFNFLSFKENLFLRIYYSVKINIIYYLFFVIYIFLYYKFFNANKNKFTTFSYNKIKGK